MPRWAERDAPGSVLAVLEAGAGLEWLMIDRRIIHAHQPTARARRPKGDLMLKGWAAPAAA